MDEKKSNDEEIIEVEIDSIAMDTTGDGEIDTVLLDTTGDGGLDTAVDLETGEETAL